MRFRRFLKWVFPSLAVLLLAAGVALFTLDLGFLRGTIEGRLARATGRDVSIDGELSIRLGRQLVVEANAVRVGNAPWAGPENLADFGRLAATVNTLSLWKGPLVVRQLSVSDARLRLQRNAEGLGNWQLQAPGPARDGDPVAWPLIESLALSGIDIDLQSPRLDRPVSASIGLLEQTVGDDGLVRFRLDAELSGRPVHFEGSGGPYGRIQRGDDVRFEGNGNLGDIRIDGRLGLDNLWTPQRPDIDLRLAGPEFAELTEMLGIEGLGSGRLDLAITTGVAADRFVATLAGNLGRLAIDVRGEMPSLQDIGKAAFEAHVEGPNLGRIARLAGVNDWPEEPFVLDAVVQRPDVALNIEKFILSLGRARIDLAGRLPAYPALTDGVFDLTARGPDFGRIALMAGREGMPREAFDINARLSMAGDELVIERFALDLAGADIGLQGRMPEFPGLQRADLVLSARGPDLAPFQDMLGLASPLSGPFDVNGNVAVEGDRTLLELQYRTRLAGGRVSGSLGGEGLVGTDLALVASGPRADAMGELLDMAGLPAAPWTLNSRAAVTDPAFLELRDTRFETQGITLDISGRVGSEALDRGTDVEISVSGNRLSDFQSLAGEAAPLPELPFSLRGRVTARDTAWDLQAMSGSIGTTGFRLSGQLGKGAKLAGTRLAIEANGTDLGSVLPLPGGARLPDGPFESQVQFGVNGGRLGIASLQVSAGPFRLRASADVPWPFDRSNGTFTLEASGRDVTRVLPEFGGLVFDARDFETHFAGAWKAGRITIDRGDARIGETSLTAGGSLDLPPDLSATDLLFEMRSPDLSKLGVFNGKRWKPLPINFRSAFTGTESRFLMEQFKANLGDTVFNGALSIDFAPDKPAFDLQLRTASLDLRPFLADPAESGRKEAAPVEKGARFIPEIVFPMETLARANGRFAITTDRLVLRRATLVNGILAGVVQNGALDASEIGIDGHAGRLAATLALLPRTAGGADMRLTARSKGLVLDLRGLPDAERAKLPPYDVDIDLGGSGTHTREVASKLNGKVIVNSPGGQIRNFEENGLKALFLAQVVSAVSPNAARQKEINISCFAAAMNAADGTLFLDPGMALQSDRLNLFASGKVNLGTEKLDVNFRAQTRKAVDVSAGELFSPYVKLSGTLAEPSVALDTRGTLLSGGAAYLSGGLSILARKALDQLGGTKDPCADYLREVKAGAPPGG